DDARAAPQAFHCPASGAAASRRRGRRDTLGAFRTPQRWRVLQRRRRRDAAAPRGRLPGEADRPRSPVRPCQPDRQRTMMRSLTLRAAFVSLVLFAVFIAVWHVATLGGGPAAPMDPEYARLMGATATQGKSAMPGPLDVGKKLWEHLKDPFYDRGS